MSLPSRGKSQKLSYRLCSWQASVRSRLSLASQGKRNIAINEKKPRKTAPINNITRLSLHSKKSLTFKLCWHGNRSSYIPPKKEIFFRTTLPIITFLSCVIFCQQGIRASMTPATDTCKYSWIRDFKIGVLFRLPRTANVKFSFNVALSAQFKTCRSQLNVRSAVLW